MEEDLNRLDTWYSLVRSDKELSCSEAREIAKKIWKSSSLVERRRLREELVLGSMHGLYDFLKDFGLINICNGSFDQDDIINTFCEVWIENLENSLYHAKDYSDVFNRNFFDKINDKLGLKNRRHLFESLSREEFDEVFNWFFKTTFEGGKVTLNSFLYYLERYKKFDSSEYATIYRLLDDCFNLYAKHSNGNIPLTNGYLSFLRDFLIDSVYDDYKDFFDVGYFDNARDLVYRNDIRRLVFDSDILSDNQKKILYSKYGFDGKGVKSCKDVYLEHGLKNPSSVSALERIALRNLKVKSKIYDYYLD